MSATTDSEFDRDAVSAATQAAVDATATLYTEDAGLDVEQRLRMEMQERGLDVEDDPWITEVAHRIRSGHDVQVGVPPQRGNA
jgi:hypothetical protein